MESKITTGHCRMCLKPCRNVKYEISVENAQLYQQVTGFRISPTDSLKYICHLCEELLQKLHEFKLTAMKAEIILKDVTVESKALFPTSTIAIVPEIKTETEQNFDVESDFEDTDYFDGAHESLSSENSFKESDRGTEEKVTSFLIDENLTQSKAETIDKPLDKNESQSMLQRPLKIIRKRGRPRKPRQDKELSTPKRKRGRPKTTHILKDDQVKRKRGRPKKPIDENLSQNSKQVPLEKLRQRYPSLGKLHTCQVCGRNFRNRLRLECHEASAHIKELNMPIYECALCSRQFGSKKVLAIHLRDHHAERRCPECDKLYTTAKGLRLHRQTIHPKVKQDITCDRCGKIFNTFKYLRAHEKTHEHSYRCPLCPNQFYSCSSTLRFHLSSRHKEIKLPPLGTPLRNFDWSKHLDQNV